MTNFFHYFCYPVIFQYTLLYSFLIYFFIVLILWKQWWCLESLHRQSFLFSYEYEPVELFRFFWWVERSVPQHAFNIPLTLSLVLLFEGETGLQHDIKRHCQTPNINCLSRVALHFHDLWAYIRGWSTDSEEVVISTWLIGFRKAEINELGVEVMVDHNVLCLYVPMGDVQGVEVLSGADDLPEYFGSNRLRKGTELAQIVVELEALNVLHRDVDVGISPNGLVNLRDVRVAQFWVDKNLFADLLHLMRLQCLNVYNFNSNLQISVQLYCLMHICISSFSNKFF